MPERRLAAALAGWRTVVTLLALGQVSIGAMILIDGPDAFPGTVFEQINILPWWQWGTWAATGGLLMLWPHTRSLGLVAASLWYALWSALLTIGIVALGGPLYAVAAYLTTAALHILVLVVDTGRDGAGWPVHRR